MNEITALTIAGLIFQVLIIRIGLELICWTLMDE